MTNHIKHSILAVYRPSPVDPDAPTLMRHVSDVSATKGAHSAIEDAIDAAQWKAQETAPEGHIVSAMMAVNTSDPKGYAATMAKVNLGTPGRPA